jgi:hypothetical protein
MVKREELQQKTKEKILLIGETGVGKTFTVVKIAEFVAQHEQDVVFIDPERGAERELELLSDEVLGHINLKDCPDWESFKRAIWSEDSCFLKVVDGLSEAFVASKIWLEDRYVAHGEYMVGESEVKIKDKEVFTLPWQGYSKVYDFIGKICHELVKQKPHIIVTMHSFGKTATKEKLEGDVFRKFDTIMELRRTVSATPPSIVYDAMLKKHRGRPFIAYVSFSGYVDKLKELFGKRMGLEEVKP